HPHGAGAGPGDDAPERRQHLRAALEAGRAAEPLRLGRPRRQDQADRRQQAGPEDAMLHHGGTRSPMNDASRSAQRGLRGALSSFSLTVVSFLSRRTTTVTSSPTFLLLSRLLTSSRSAIFLPSRLTSTSPTFSPAFSAGEPSRTSTMVQVSSSCSSCTPM